MARAEPKHHGTRHGTEGTDDVEKSLELLDKVLSEFEEPDSLPPAEPESPSQGHQSEDDGYMSMNGRRAKFAPGFQPTDEAELMAPPPPHPVPPDEKLSSTSPPPPEEAERIISDLLPRISPSNTISLNNSSSASSSNSGVGSGGSSGSSITNCNNNDNSNSNIIINNTNNSNNHYTATTHSISNKEWNERKNRNVLSPPDAKSIVGIISNGGDDSLEVVPPLQTTLPKTRPSGVFPSRYASLPCSSPPKPLGPTSLDGGRNVLGIGISAVHDAVLRGVARMPESIVNEHPVTIYPGRASPTRKVPPRTLPGSFERHRDVCRQNYDSDGTDPQQQQYDNTDEKLMNLMNASLTPPPPLPLHLITTQYPVNRTPSSTTLILHQTVLMSDNNLHLLNNTKNAKVGRNKKKTNSDSEEFSDDSLEDSSLPPPPPPPVIPPPPSLSAPVTPSKRGSIAWEVNLDDPSSFDDPMMTKTPNSGSTKIIGRRRGKSVSGSQSSLASTPGHSTATSNKRTESVEWPDPPDPPICSTEDEATSLYSDSDDVIPYTGDVMGRGTYVIRKGRKQRQKLCDIDLTSSINSRLSNEGNFLLPSPVFPISMMLPNSRHSIDLGSPPPPPPPVQNSLNSPRSRLSLDLSSPTSELPVAQITPTITTPTTAGPTNSTTIISPRYTEFKTYSSTFDGLQALDNNNSNNHHNSNSNIASNSNNIVCNGLPLMRVASLPAITPPPPITGDTITTPRRELAPPLEEDEEQDSESQRGAPLRQIENNISALLRGDIAVARVGDIPLRRPLGFRPGVHKSESAKEMLLSQTNFGPLPPSPPSSSPEAESDEFPPLPPSPIALQEEREDYVADVVPGLQGIRISSRNRIKSDHHYRDMPDHPPAVPPHRGPSINTLKTRSMDAGFSKSYRNGPYASISPQAPGTLPPDLPGSSSRRRYASGAFPKRSAQSPREERRLQTSCSLPETPIFARGCDIPRTPHRRAPELPGTGSRTAPRQTSTGMSSIIGIGNTQIGNRQRSINHALASGEMLRLAGGPARGWYPKQRHARPASTENIDRLHPQGSIRAWDAGTGSRKPLTLPPNLTPKFFNKSPREALRRVTSLLIRKGNSKDKDTKKDKDKEKMFSSVVHRSPGSAVEIGMNTTIASSSSSSTTPSSASGTPAATTHKKKGFFKSFWKKSKHYSLEQ